MSLQKKKSFNKEYYLQIHFQTNIHRGKNPNQTNREVNLHGKFNTCQLVFYQRQQNNKSIVLPKFIILLFWKLWSDGS